MISAKGPNIDIKGTTPAILAEFTLISRDLRELLEEKCGKEKAIEIIDSAYNDSKKTKEQLIKTAADLIKDKDIAEVIEAIVEAMKEVYFDE